MDTGVIGSDWDLHCARDGQTDRVSSTTAYPPPSSLFTDFRLVFVSLLAFSFIGFRPLSLTVLSPILGHYLSLTFASLSV